MPLSNDDLFARIQARIDKQKFDMGTYQNALDCLLFIKDEQGLPDVQKSHSLLAQIRRDIAAARERLNPDFASKIYPIQRKLFLYGAPECFDDYCLYMEMNRPFKKQFYLPRRKQLHRLAVALESLSRRELELLAISMPPGTGKTTLALFFLTWIGGKHPEWPNLTGSHSNAFLRGAYDECLRLMDKDGEYLWHDVFPEKQVIKTNAQDMMIDIGKDRRSAKRFTTLEFSSIGSGNAGKVRAEGLLYCDDLVDGLETALSRERMDKLWNMYTTDLRQRKIGNAVELHIATRWSVHDVIGRLSDMYSESDKARFIVMPALDENDQSNFGYPIDAGFTTKFYMEQREVMDDASWRALYMNQPIEREGQLYPEEELRRYFELPDGEPDAILSVCDTKDKGKDYAVLPIVYQYGQDYYLEDMVCDNGNPDIVEERIIGKLVAHNAHFSRFESNSAGGRIAQKVQAEVKRRGARTKVTTKFTSSNKETKILANSPWVKEHCLFKDNSVIKRNKEYRRFLQFLTGYTLAGKNAHDDVPDAMAMLAEYCESMTNGTATIQRSPFRM